MMIKKLLFTTLFILSLTSSAFAFDVPTANYTPDSYDVLLLHNDGVDGSQTIPDSSTTTSKGNATAVGTAQLDTAQHAFSGDTSSLLLDGNSDYITYADHADYTWGTGNFSIDLWVKWTGFPATADYFWVQEVDGTHRLLWYMGSDKKAAFYSVGAGAVYLETTSALTLSTSTWYHLACVRNGTTLLMYLDGSSQALTGTQIGTTDLTDLAGTVYIGTGGNGSDRFLNGWIDEFRVGKGVARDWLPVTRRIIMITYGINIGNPYEVGTPLWSCRIKLEAWLRNIRG